MGCSRSSSNRSGSHSSRGGILEKNVVVVVIAVVVVVLLVKVRGSRSNSRSVLVVGTRLHQGFLVFHMFR